MALLILAEHEHGSLCEQTAKALAAAQDIGSDIDILVAGKGVSAVAEEAAKLKGVRKVLLAEADYLQHQLAEPLADLIVSLSKDYDVFVSPSTTTGRNVMPRVAALLDVMQISDVIEVVSKDTFKRPIYAGNAVETVQSLDKKKVMTIRTTSFQAAGTGGKGEIEKVKAPADPALSRFVREEKVKNERPELTAAKVVVSGGRGLASEKQFMGLLQPLADKLNAALGASRAAVDAGYAPNDWQVGQTGKIVAPELYIAVGISGAIQHLAGMKESRIIVAINKDEEAPMMQVADYALVGDLFEIVPQLEKAL